MFLLHHFVYSIAKSALSPGDKPPGAAMNVFTGVDIPLFTTLYSLSTIAGEASVL